MPQDQHRESNRSVLKSAGVMSAAVFLSRILGLVREQVFAALFGASHATDAYQIAFRIPNLLRDLFAEGAMSAALVPTFIQVQNESGDDRAWQVATRVFVVLFVTVSVLASLGILFAEPIIRYYAGAYRAVPGKFELTVRLTRIMIPFFPLVALAAGFMAILNACGKFFMPAFASAMFNVVSIVTGVGLAGLAPRWGFEPIEGMAYGVVAGGFAQALIQWPILRRQGYRPLWSRPDPARPLRDPALRRMMLLMIPGTVGLAATQVNILVNSVFATSVGTGAVSWLNYAFRLMQFPIGVFGVSLASATLPVFSRAWSGKDYAGASNALLKTVKRVFAINFPASCGLAFLGVPIIALIFEHGRFARADTIATAQALAAYAVGLTAYSVVKVLVPICYAIGETRLAVFSSVFAVVSNLAFCLLFVKRLGFVGLALGTSLTAILNSILLWHFIARRLKSNAVALPTGEMLKALFAYGGIALAMGGLVFASDQALAPHLHAAARVAVGMGIGMGSYFLLGTLFKLEESLDLLETLKRRLAGSARAK